MKYAARFRPGRWKERLSTVLAHVNTILVQHVFCILRTARSTLICARKSERQKAGFSEAENISAVKIVKIWSKVASLNALTWALIMNLYYVPLVTMKLI